MSDNHSLVVDSSGIARALLPDLECLPRNERPLSNDVLARWRCASLLMAPLTSIREVSECPVPRNLVPVG